MSKAESGWHFDRMPTQTTADIVRSEPVAFVVRKPAPAQPLRGQACMDQKLVEFRNAPANIKFKEEAGIELRVPYEVYEDWADECGYVPARTQ